MTLSLFIHDYTREVNCIHTHLMCFIFIWNVKLFCNLFVLHFSSFLIKDRVCMNSFPSACCKPASVVCAPKFKIQFSTAKKTRRHFANCSGLYFRRCAKTQPPARQQTSSERQKGVCDVKWLLGKKVLFKAWWMEDKKLWRFLPLLHALRCESFCTRRCKMTMTFYLRI